MVVGEKSTFHPQPAYTSEMTIPPETEETVGRNTEHSKKKTGETVERQRNQAYRVGHLKQREKFTLREKGH